MVHVVGILENVSASRESVCPLLVGGVPIHRGDPGRHAAANRLEGQAMARVTLPRARYGRAYCSCSVSQVIQQRVGSFRRNTYDANSISSLVSPKRGAGTKCKQVSKFLRFLVSKLLGFKMS